MNHRFLTHRNDAPVHRRKRRSENGGRVAQRLVRIFDVTDYLIHVSFLTVTIVITYYLGEELLRLIRSASAQ